MNVKDSFRVRDICFIALGAAIYAFGFVYFYMANQIAANGLAGLTLVFHALFDINPSYSGYAINLPLILLGAYLFGKKSILYTLEGIVCLYFFVWLFQKIPFVVDLEQDLLVISLVSGLIAGLGGGLVFRFGGTIGGSDIIARAIEEKLGLPLNQALLGIDIFVMLLSLTYITVPRMMYALIASFIYSQVVNLIQNGGYAVRGMMIISDQSAAISALIMEELGRGVTYLKGEGAYSGREKNVMYVALSLTDAREAKRMIREADPDAFVSIFNIDEVISPEYRMSKSKYRKS